MNGISAFGDRSRPYKAEVVFSLDDGYAWASWPDSPAKVRLGEYSAVVAMMKDFLAHARLAERLADPDLKDSNPGTGGGPTTAK